MSLIVITAAIGLPALLPLVAKLLDNHPLMWGSAVLSAAFKKVVMGAFTISAACGVLIALVQIFSLVTRNVFGVNFIAVQESLLYLFGSMFLLGAGGLYLLDGHVRVDVFYSHWSARRQKVLNLLGSYLFLFPVCILVVYASAPYVATSWASLERSSEPSGIHAVFLLKTLIPTFGILTAMAGFIRVHQILHGGRDV